MKTSVSLMLCTFISLCAASVATLATRAYLDKRTAMELVYACDDKDDGKTKTPPTEWLEYKANGDVWVRWTDGRFIEVLPRAKK
jgi:hypothetical protein